MRYIDADKLKEFYEPYAERKLSVPVDVILLNIDDMPSADVQEIKHGRWIKKYRGNFVCSVCGTWYRTIDDYGSIIDGEINDNYCETCGAKMDEVEEKNEG